MIINSHVHVYPDKIASKAAMAIGAFYNAPIKYNGTILEMLKEGKAAGVDKFLIHSVATKPEQVKSINDFIYGEMQTHDEFIGFMALHPDMDSQDIENEVNRCLALGFKGVKLHPDCQKFFIDEDRAEKIYKIVEGKLPILMHMGDPRYDFSGIARLVSVLNKHKDLQVSAAHMGGYARWNEIGIDHNAKYNNYHFDTSSSLAFLSKEQVNLIISEFGAEKFFFGTDYPMWDSKDELERIDALGLSQRDEELILGENLKEFLKL